MSVLLSVQGLGKSYGARRVLDIAHLAIERGECLLLSGDNGSGKTTLLRILAGLLPADAGEFRLDEVSGPWDRVYRALRRCTVYLHQQPYLFRGTVLDNVAYGLRVTGHSPDRARRKALEALSWVGLAHLAPREAARLSGGESQRVALARAHLLQPDLLLLDEPLASLDAGAREQAVELLSRWRREGTTMLVTSHEPERLFPLTDRRLVLERGRLRETGGVEVPA